MKKIICVIQARMGSKRLPGKVLLKIAGKTLVETAFERLKSARMVDDIVLSTSFKKENDILVEHARDIGLKFYRGSEEDMISRLLGTLREFQADAMVRVTADCPLVDPKIVDGMVKIFKEKAGRIDLLTNSFPPTYPHGFNIEVVPRSILEKLDSEVSDLLYREWFNVYIMENKRKFIIHNVKHPTDLSQKIRLTVDYPEDLDLVRRICEYLGAEGRIFDMEDILDYLEKNPHLIKINEMRIDKVVVGDIQSAAFDELRSSRIKKSQNNVSR